MATLDFDAACIAAGITTQDQANLAVSIIKSFIDAGISSKQIADAFAQRSALQMESVALTAAVQNKIKARDDAAATANADIAATQQQINAVVLQLQQTVPSA